MPAQSESKRANDRPATASGPGAADWADAGMSGRQVEEGGSAPSQSDGPFRHRWLFWLEWLAGRQWHEAQRAPAFLVSFIVHAVVLLLLAILTLPRQLDGGKPFELEAAWIDPRDRESPEQVQLAAGDSPPPPSEVEQEFEVPREARPAGEIPISELLQVERTVEQTSGFAGELEQILAASESSLAAGFSSTGVEGREPRRRRQIALARGGTLETEQAVEAALEWLARHQRPTGAWSLVHSQGECNGRCGNDGSQGRFDPAATGLSLLAFLGAGYTHREGKYRETVRKGVYFLLQIMEETPQGGSFLYQSDRGMYNHGIAAFALCEAYQLTDDPDLKQAAQKAIDFIVSAQNYQGGWGYLARQPGDLTISGWQTMALKSGFAAGLDIPGAAIIKIDPFLDSQMSESQITYGYRAKGGSPTCTAIGMLVRLFRNWPHTDPRIMAGADYLLKRGPSNSDAYFNYYATLTLFHLGGGYWETWNPQIRQHLVNTQVHQGHAAGSWYFENPFGKEGGRLYTTAMCAMTLEVYYRFSPLYQQADEPFEL